MHNFICNEIVRQTKNLMKQVIFVKMVLVFIVPFFFLGHVFGSMVKITQCIQACSSTMKIMHTYHRMIH